jgi:hypothetical protein
MALFLQRNGVKTEITGGGGGVVTPDNVFTWEADIPYDGSVFNLNPDDFYFIRSSANGNVTVQFGTTIPSIGMYSGYTKHISAEWSISTDISRDKNIYAGSTNAVLAPGEKITLSNAIKLTGAIAGNITIREEEIPDGGGDSLCYLHEVFITSDKLGMNIKVFGKRTQYEAGEE